MNSSYTKEFPEEVTNTIKLHMNSNYEEITE